MIRAFVIRVWPRVFFWCSPLSKKARALRMIFRNVDRQVSVFQKKSGLQCPERCGHCCVNSFVETTTLEMLPVAEDLVRRGKGTEAWQKADARGTVGQCVFYQEDVNSPDHGRCGIYAFRPLVCRMFGFSGNPDKYGKPRLTVCAVMKKVSSEMTDKASELVDEGKTSLPLMTQAAMLTESVDPEMARQRLPVNEALKEAIERMELERKYKQSK